MWFGTDIKSWWSHQEWDALYTLVGIKASAADIPQFEKMAGTSLDAVIDMANDDSAFERTTDRPAWDYSEDLKSLSKNMSHNEAREILKSIESRWARLMNYIDRNIDIAKKGIK